MNIVTEKKKNGRLQDGIATILKLDDTSFGKVLAALNPNGKLEDFCFFYTTDRCEIPSNPIQLGYEEVFKNGNTVMRAYYASDSRMPASEVLPQIEKLKEGFPEGSRERSRIESLLMTRNLNSFKGYFVNKYPDIKYGVVDKVFDILSDDELFRKFLDYKENEQEFQIQDVENPKKEILRCIALIFGNKREVAVQGHQEIFRGFYIPDMDSYTEKVLELYKTFNYVRYTDSRYEFNEHFSDFEKILPSEEPEFEISKELRDAVYNGMPDDLSDEEKVVFIYSRLCLNLLYNEEYMYRDMLEKDRYKSDFSKEKLENLKPGSKVTCYDFSRVFAKMSNEISDDVEAVIISPGNGRGHFLVGVFSEKMSAEFDAINIEKGQHTDDLMKAKAGIELGGIQTRYDDDEVLYRAIKNIYPIAVGKPRTRMGTYLRELRNDTPEDFENNLEVQLKTFVDTLREQDIVGNEFVQAFTSAIYDDYFSQPLERAYIGKKSEVDGRKHFTRLLLLRQRDYYVRRNTSDIYLIDTSNLTLEKTPKTEIAEKLQSGEYVYEDVMHRMKGIEDD